MSTTMINFDYSHKQGICLEIYVGSQMVFCNIQFLVKAYFLSNPIDLTLTSTVNA